jgi:hypothetical protein
MSLKLIIKTKISETVQRHSFKKGYQRRVNIIKDENGNLLDPQSVLNRWKFF